MAKGDRPDGDPPRGTRRRRRPPTLDLKATEVRPELSRAEAPKATRPEQPKTDEQVRSDAFDWRGLLTNAQVTGVVGVAAGAVLVFALMVLFGGRGSSDTQVSELAQEVKNLSTRVETLTSRTPTFAEPGALGQRLDRLTSAIGETEQRLASLERRPLPQPPDLTTVNQRTAAIETTLKDLRGALADIRRMAEQAPPAATPQAVDALTDRIAGLEERISTLAAARPAAAASSLALEIGALNALSDAVQSGRPFAKELEAARARLGDRAGPLALLEPYADNGVPSVAALAERFSELAPQLLRPSATDNGVLARLLSNASRLVEVRPVGEPQGNSAGEVIARVETKLGRGDLAAALAEVESLPASVKSAASAWIAAATQRRDAEQTVRRLIDAALATGAGRKQS
jgi:hypothetical protein